jgi:hypothetical protein
MNPDPSQLTRRRFIQQVSAGALAAAAGLGGASRLVADDTEPGWDNRGFGHDWSQIRGFNYQPSYGSSGFELWQKFDAQLIETEVGRGKRYFPRINTLRWWQSWDSFIRGPAAYAAHFETTLGIAARFDLLVMPVLFNRWHTSSIDYGGIYIDHFLPGASGMQREKMFDAFLEALVGRHKDDPRILAWDLCNEPFFYGSLFPQKAIVMDAELAWLTNLRATCKLLGAQSPITVGIAGMSPAITDPLCDVLSMHPYLTSNSEAARKNFGKRLDDAVAFARKAGKPLLASECCWGSLDDKTRVEFIRNTLAELKQRRIGWTAYLLHHSLIADAHRPEFGPVNPKAGDLAFIEADGSLRLGHEAFNEY